MEINSPETVSGNHVTNFSGNPNEIHSKDKNLVGIFGSAETDPVRFKWGFGEGRLKDKFAFFEAYKNPIPKRRKQLAKRLFL